MKKLVLLIFLSVIWLSSFEVSFSGDDGYNTLFYFSLFPGIINSNDEKTARILISSPTNSPVEITKQNISLKENIYVRQNDFTDFWLYAEEVQPTTKYKYNTPSEKPVEKVFKNSAVKMIIKGTPDATAIIQTKYSDNSDGISLLKVASLGVTYKVSNPSTTKHSDTIPSNYIAIVSPYDDTPVRFYMGGITGSYVNMEEGSVLKPGFLMERTLEEGDVWLIPLGSITGNLAGSTITSIKPFAVFSGSNSAYISGSETTSYTINQERPTDDWGDHYLIPTLPDRELYPIVNICSGSLKATISEDGVPKWYIDNPWGITYLGYIEAVAGQKKQGETKPHPVVISSNFGINVAIINPQTGKDASSTKPFQLQIVPTIRFTYNSIFKIDNVEDDNINIIYMTSDSGKIPDGIMITKITDGKFKWEKLNTITSDTGQPYIGNIPYYSNYSSLNLKLPEAGVYGIKSDVPLIVYQFGNGNSVYGYPVSGYVNELNTNDTLAPFVEFSLDSSCSAIGTVTDEPRFDPDNRSNLGIIGMSQDDSYNFIFDYDSFEPGVTISTNWRAKVHNPLLNARAHLFFMDRVGNRKDTIIECTPIVSVLENDIINSIEIHYDNGFLRFSSKEDYQIDEIEIYDLSGKLILSDKMNKTLNGYSLRTTNFTSGVFIVKMYINGMWFSKKVII